MINLTLFGHECSKTTEVFTYVTTMELDQIKNCLNILDIK